MAGFSIPAFNFIYQGLPASSGTLNVYQTGTTTPVTIYSDGGLTTPISNPLTLDANGQAKFYTSGAVNLRLDAFTSTGVLIESIDPVYPTGQSQTISAGFFTTEQSLASATTTDLGSVTTTNIINITGTTTITSFGSSANTNNPLYFIRFSGILTLTNNNTSLILPTAANITTAAGDAAIMKYEGAGNWRCINYMLASGKSLSGFSATPIVNSLSGDVACNNVSNYFDGPSVAQGTSGTWFASGYVTVSDPTNAQVFYAKLWDGTTLIASGTASVSVTTASANIALSGFLASPAANLRISVRAPSFNTGKILFSNSGLSKDSTITAYRIA